MFEFRLPDVGEGVAEGEVVAWHVEQGETVAEDQVLAEVETDKAVVDLPSPVAGTVAELHAAVGDVVPVGDVLVTIDAAGESAADEAEAEAAPADAAAQAGDAAAAEQPTATATDSQAASDADGADTPGGRVFAPPHVRRLGRELGVDLTTVAGSGPGGRLTERDVREAAGEGAAGDQEARETDAAVDEATADAAVSPASAAKVDEETAPPAGEPAGREKTLAVPATRKLAMDRGVDIDDVPTDRTRDGEAFVGPAEVRAYAEGATAAGAGAGAGAQAGAATDAATADEPASDASARGADSGPTAGRVEAYRGIRRTIGEKMAESKYTAPHVTHHDSVDVSGLVEARETLRERAEAAGVSLTYTAFVLKAVAAALQEYPVLNSRLDEESEEIVYHDAYNLGVATATDAGLMVPVVDDVDQKGLLDIAREVSDLTARARDRSIAREEMQGGTFTVTNVGAIGGEYATPIINHPETAILGLGSIEERPWVVDGEVVARPVLPLSLSIDHRVIDGAEAARFTNTVMDSLETPSLLLLE